MDNKNTKKILSEDQLKKIKQEISESLATDRHALISDFPFTGSISMRLDLIPVRDKRVRTACTDGRSVYFDCDFYSQLTKSERLFVLAHEIWHCVMLHLARKQTREQHLFNIATDMEVNNILVDNINGTGMSVPADLLFPPQKLKGKSAEVIYEYLLKERAKQQKKQQQSSGAGSSKSNNKSQNKDEIDGDESFDDISGDGSDEYQQGSSGGNNSSTGKKGSKSDKKDKGLSGQFDKHTYTDDNGSDKNNDEISDQWGEVGFDEDFRPNVPSDIADRMREAITAAAQATERMQGTLPAGVKSLLDKITKPEIKWQEVLSQFVTSCYNGKRRWLPPNRRHVYNDTYFQSRRNETVNIIVAIDTSGSCIGDLPKFFGELKGLVDTFGSYTIHMIQCDAAVASYELYDDNNQLELEEASKIKWAGGGGTSFCPVFKFIEQEGITADCLIYLTDGYGDAPKNPPPYPTLWLLTKDGSRNFCDWGRKIRFKESAYDY